MIQVLPESRWPELTDIFAREFNASLPHSGRAQILADVDEEGNILGFVVTEILVRVGQIYKIGNKGYEMLRHLERHMLRDSAVVAISSSPDFDSLCEKFGMRRVEGTVFRRDF
jgi:hypothetical protein